MAQTIDDLDLTPPDELPDLATWLARNFKIILDAAGASAPIITVFGRTGNVVALLADYDSFFLTQAEADVIYEAINANIQSHISDSSIHTEDNLLVHLAGDETITGIKTFANEVIIADTSGARLKFTQEDAATDNKNWDFKVGLEQLQLRVFKDDFSTFSVVFAVDRTGITVNFFNLFCDLIVSGDITLGGTVDGRDVAVDGTKLDTIETGAEVNAGATGDLKVDLTEDWLTMNAAAAKIADVVDGQITGITF